MATEYMVVCDGCGSPMFIYIDNERVTVKTVSPTGDATLIEAKKLGTVSASADTQ